MRFPRLIEGVIAWPIRFVFRTNDPGQYQQIAGLFDGLIELMAHVADWLPYLLADQFMDWLIDGFDNRVIHSFSVLQKKGT